MTARTTAILRTSLLAALVLWGAYTFLSYIGIPVHQSVLLSGDQQQAVKDACTSGSLVCTEWHSVLPAILYVFQRSAPFLWYVIWSLVFYGCLLGFEFFRSGKADIRLKVTPLKLILIFIGLLWLLFTVLSTGGQGDQPYRQVYLPNAKVYPSIDAQTMQVLTDDYNEMKARGCLVQVQDASAGVEVSTVRESCIQESFVTRVLSEVGCILALLLVMLSFGRMILMALRPPHMRPVLEALLSVGLGACGMIVVLWTFAVAGLYTMTAGWLILIALPAIAWRHTWYWLKSLRGLSWEYSGPWYGGALLLSWLLISYLVLNFLTVVRPFPIGWDDLGVYLNDPRLLVSYGHFITRMFAFQWEYATSLGFLLFGYDSWFGATTSMLINWMAGLLAVCTIYTFGTLFLGRKSGIIAALVYYTLPLVGHFSFADMKVDNAVFTMGALAVLTAFIALFPFDDHHEDEHPHTFHWTWIVLAGIFGGFGFAMKPTVIMVVMSLFSVFLGVLLAVGAFLGGGFLAWTVFVYQGVFNAKDIFQRTTGNPDAVSQNAVLAFCLLVGAAILGYCSFLQPKKVRHAALVCLVFFGVFFATLVPWVIHNNVFAGNVIPKLLLTAPNPKVVPDFILNGATVPPGSFVRVLPKDLQVDFNSDACKGGTSKKEELDRYWGYDTGVGHYLGLPWRTVMNADSAGYYVTTAPALLLFPLLLLLPYFWTKKGRWLRWLFLATVFMTIQWIFFANGIPWYGIGMFLGLAIGLEALVIKAPDRSTKIAASVFLFLSFVCAFSHRFWQFETQKNLYTYPLGVVSAPAMEERTIPHYNNIREIVLDRAKANPDMPYVFRIGTFIPYFIPKNLEILPVADNQMDLFTCLNQGGADPQLTLRRMKALGFNSIIFDTNTATIERDPNGTLHKKVQKFLDFVNTPSLGLQVVVNDQDGGIAFLLLP